jgi:hypothetical protein
MCMILTKNWKRNRRGLRSKSTPITLYKVVKIAKDYDGKYELKAPIFQFWYRKGINISGRLTNDVLKDEIPVLNYGFHFFRHQKDAKLVSRKIGYGNMQIIKIKIDRKDIVASGLNSYSIDPNDSLNGLPVVVVSQFNLPSSEYNRVINLAKG